MHVRHRQPASASQGAVETWREALAATFGDPQWQASFNARLVRALTREPTVAGDADLLRLADRKIAENTRLFQLVLSGEVEIGPDFATPMSTAFARALARRGFDTATFERITTAAHEAAWDGVRERLRERLVGSPAYADALEHLTNHFVRFDIALIEGVRRVFHHERQLLSAEVRDRTIERLLDGEEDDGSLARRFRYDPALSQIALVAWAASGDPSNALVDRETLERLLSDLDLRARLVGELPHGAVAWVRPRGGTDRWIVPPELPKRLGLAVAVGTPQPGVDGLRRSYEEAVAAHRVALLNPRPAAPVTSYAEVGAVALATSGEQAARQFVERQLGPLLDPDPRYAALRTTLLTFIEHRGRTSSAADDLGVHVNTVINRVRAAEALLPETASERTSDLALALRLAGHLAA
ncbi:PucR family transcriptional regulator [Patulibacter defluvii]|uniref:PucR family transcriptional regulator n=1 Tax=Patulibacter defluvii TaxID=3095358 RepID=UPI002A74A23D|nr:helix-turn-helix domain-containing protein [Patulibacter sp. DM4]